MAQHASTEPGRTAKTALIGALVVAIGVFLGMAALIAALVLNPWATWD